MTTGNANRVKEAGTPYSTLVLAGFAEDLDGKALPGGVKALLGDLLLDYVRVASIGAGMSWSGWARDYIRALGNEGPSPLLFETRGGDPVRTAFLNATYAGSIDADDTHVGSMLHPGCIVISAALAVSREASASGADFAAAIVAGYEAMIRIGLSIQPTHFHRGFQSTATCGGFGAAVAAARLLFGRERNAARRIAETIGLAASFSGGLTQFYKSGSSVKRIHAARAAENGVASALMAKSGFGGPTDILEGENGFARAYAEAFSPAIISDGLGRDFRMLEVTVKGHACSARVQAAIEAVIALCAEHGVRADAVEDMEIGIPSVILGKLTQPRPIDVQAAQMSLPFSAALALILADRAGDGFTLSVKDFESHLKDPALAAVEARIRCIVTPEVEAKTTAESVPARVTIKLKSGKTVTTFVPAFKGSPSNPFTHADHVARFSRELGSRWPRERCAELVDLAERITDLESVERFIGLLC